MWSARNKGLQQETRKHGKGVNQQPFAPAIQASQLTGSQYQNNHTEMGGIG